MGVVHHHARAVLARQRDGRPCEEYAVALRAVSSHDVLSVSYTHLDVYKRQMYMSIDRAVDKLNRQIRRHRTKLEKRLRAGAFEPVANEPAEPEEEVATYDLVRVKKFPVKPMHVDDAIAQMELLGHTFFLFLNEETDSMCVLYLRSDGSYGLLQPE